MFPVQEISALYGLGSGVTPASYVNTPQYSVALTDVAGLDLAAYQGQLNAYNQQLQAQQGTMGGLFGLGGGILGGLARNPGLFGMSGAGLAVSDMIPGTGMTFADGLAAGIIPV